MAGSKEGRKVCIVKCKGLEDFGELRKEFDFLSPEIKEGFLVNLRFVLLFCLEGFFVYFLHPGQRHLVNKLDVFR